MGKGAVAQNGTSCNVGRARTHNSIVIVVVKRHPAVVPFSVEALSFLCDVDAAADEARRAFHP
jgi:hypothetical protein